MPGYLLKVAPDMWHVFPDEEVSQDRFMRELKSVRKFKIRYIPQKDGSRFKCLYESRELSTQQMKERIEAHYPRYQDIYFTLELEEAALRGKILRKEITPEKWVYRVWRTHKFLNGERVFPALINHSAKMVCDASVLFPENVPEDLCGRYGESAESFTIRVGNKAGEIIWKPEVVDYQSNVRLCPCCSVVSDISKPRREPWLSKVR